MTNDATTPLPSPAEVLDQVAALWRRVARPGEEAELQLRFTQGLTVDLDPASGLRQESLGGGCYATVQLWTSSGEGRVEGGWTRPEEIGDFIEAARRSVGPRSATPPPGKMEPVPGGERPTGAPDLDRARTRASAWAGELAPLGTCIQALLVQESLGWAGVFHSSGATAYDWLARSQALVRCETPRGALVDGVALPRLEGGLELAPATARLKVALEAVGGEGAALNPALPLVLRPPVAGPLVSGLAWALGGDVAASVPGLVRAVGKKLFPGVLSVHDDPRHPAGTVRRFADDEGRRADPVTPIQAGQLLGFLHSRASAARLGVPSNGRALRLDGGAASPGACNLHVAPGTGALPEDRTELTARVETFTTMRQPGVVSLLAWGWEYRRGERLHRVGPLELELPVLVAFRQLQAVGADLTFLPASDGCGTPTLVFAPPTWLADPGSR